MMQGFQPGGPVTIVAEQHDGGPVYVFEYPPSGRHVASIEVYHEIGTLDTGAGMFGYASMMIPGRTSTRVDTHIDGEVKEVKRFANRAAYERDVGVPVPREAISTLVEVLQALVAGARFEIDEDDVAAFRAVADTIGVEHMSVTPRALAGVYVHDFTPDTESDRPKRCVWCGRKRKRPAHGYDRGNRAFRVKPPTFTAARGGEGMNVTGVVFDDAFRRAVRRSVGGVSIGPNATPATKGDDE